MFTTIFADIFLQSSTLERQNSRGHYGDCIWQSGKLTAVSNFHINPSLHIGAYVTWTFTDIVNSSPNVSITDVFSDERKSFLWLLIHWRFIFDTEHFSEKNVAFSRGKNHWSFTFFSEHFSEKKCCFFKGKNHWRFILWHWTLQWKKCCFFKREKSLKLHFLQWANQWTQNFNIWFLGGERKVPVQWFFTNTSLKTHLFQWLFTKAIFFFFKRKTSWTSTNMKYTWTTVQWR